jgi:hypothetical protein
MHGRGIDAIGQRVTEREALLAIRGRDADLDQFVSAERTVYFRDEFRCDAGMPDAHDWFERVRTSLEPSPFARRQRCQHARIVAALAGQTPVTTVLTSNRDPAPAGLASAVLWMSASDDRSYSRIAMQALSKLARFILDRMEPDCSYEPLDLRALAPNASAEKLREVMHELWVNRHVERVGSSGWQRHRSAPPHQRPVDAQLDAPDVAVSRFRQTKVVKPEDLFDHAPFSDFFR